MIKSRVKWNGLPVESIAAAILFENNVDCNKLNKSPHKFAKRLFIYVKTTTTTRQNVYSGIYIL